VVIVTGFENAINVVLVWRCLGALNPPRSRSPFLSLQDRMDWLKRVVKVEATSYVPLNIRGIFSKFGEMYAAYHKLLSLTNLPLSTSCSIDLYPCKTGVRGCAHIFIKFKDEQSAILAINCKVDLPGIHVYSLSDNPRYVDQYRGVSSPVCETTDFGVSSNSRDLPVLTDLPHNSSCGRGKKGHSQRVTKFSGQFTDLLAPPTNAYLCTSALSPQSGFLKSLKSVQSRFSNPSDDVTNKQLQPISDIASNTTSLTFSTPCAPHVSTRSSLSAYVQPPLCTPGSLINPSFSLNTPLSLCFHGEMITYDLKALDSDTRPIIELLKITDSERGNWMTVGAYYRRSGNARAAMTVIQTMIEGNWALRHVTKSLI
jgi:hypothetical protein